MLALVLFAGGAAGGDATNVHIYSWSVDTVPDLQLALHDALLTLVYFMEHILSVRGEQ